LFPRQLLSFFAAEHGKGLCDGESAVAKDRVADEFKSGTSTLKSLADLVELLNRDLSQPKSDADRLHSITARKYFSVASTLTFFEFSVPFLIPQGAFMLFTISFSIFPLQAGLFKHAQLILLIHQKHKNSIHLW
jgi:hypothetical protein